MGKRADSCTQGVARARARVVATKMGGTPRAHTHNVSVVEDDEGPRGVRERGGGLTCGLMLWVVGFQLVERVENGR